MFSCLYLSGTVPLLCFQVAMSSHLWPSVMMFLAYELNSSNLWAKLNLSFKLWVSVIVTQWQENWFDTVVLLFTSQVSLLKPHRFRGKAFRWLDYGNSIFISGLIHWWVYSWCAVVKVRAWWVLRMWSGRGTFFVISSFISWLPWVEQTFLHHVLHDLIFLP